MSVSMNQTESFTVKKGAMVLQLELKRTSKGLLVNVKADPSIEEMFREWAQGAAPGSANINGRLWKGVGGKPAPTVYPIGVVPNGGGYLQAEGTQYELTRTGTQLSDDYGIHLGFLRIVGISDGVSFLIDGVYSGDAIRKLLGDIKTCLKAFYVNFMKPVDVILTMSATEV